MRLLRRIARRFCRGAVPMLGRHAAVVLVGVGLNMTKPGATAMARGLVGQIRGPAGASLLEPFGPRLQAGPGDEPEHVRSGGCAEFTDGAAARDAANGSTCSGEPLCACLLP